MSRSDLRRNARAALARFPSIEAAIRRLRRSDEVAALQRELIAARAELVAVRAELVAAREQPDEQGATARPGDDPATARPGDDPAGANPPNGGTPARATTITVPVSVAPFLTEAPPGHFYSPVPDLAEIEAQAGRIFDRHRPLPGVDLRAEEQLALFRTLAGLARETPLRRVPGVTTRYGVDNPNYGIGDAMMLLALLRHLRPKRYLEVGSGFTTALALDAREHFLGGELSVTAIEPHPELLASAVRPGDPVEILAQPVQTVPLERFAALRAGDVLFIDCSHVVKTGSDAHFLYTSVLPLVAEGVYVHVHDVFWPFEYLRHWVEWGRAWSEAYLLHAFLLHNEAFEVVLWNHYLAIAHRSLVQAELPAMLENPGGAFWMRRRRTKGAR